jgi:glucose-6-phosphate 1-epimerase
MLVASLTLSRSDLIDEEQGSTVEILLYGASVISWKAPSATIAQPTERLFVSSKAALDGSKAVRGGIPIVFVSGHTPLAHVSYVT